MRPPGMLHAAAVVSHEPHARILSIDASAAQSMPGVHAVITANDIGHQRFGRRLLDRPVLAWDRVRCAGDRIAAVAAETLAQAEAAAAAVAVAYEPLPRVTEPLAALEPDAPVLHDPAEDYTFLGPARREPDHPNIQGRLEEVQGADIDIDEVFRSASRVFTHRYTTPAQHHMYLETHATVVWLQGDDVHVVTTNKDPATFRTQFAAATGAPVERVVVHVAAVGGDFGGKGYSVDEYLCYYLTRATGRPVRAQMTYGSEFAEASVRHPATVVVRSAVDDDGRLLGTSLDVVLDGGSSAGAKPRPDLVAGRGLSVLADYRIPVARSRITTVYTNHPPGGHMRAPGAVQMQFAVESHMSQIARALGQDPIAFRIRNAGGEGPDRVSSSGKYLDIRTRHVLERLGDLLDEATPLDTGQGRGVAVNVHQMGGAGRRCTVRLRVQADGGIEIGTVLPDQGAGIDAVMCRVAARVTSLDVNRFFVRRDPHMVSDEEAGAGGSWVTHLGSRAVELASVGLRAELVAALGRLEDDVRDVRLEDDCAVVMLPSHAKSLAFGEVVDLLSMKNALPSVTRSYVADRGPASASAAALAVDVNVDPPTGLLQVVDALLVVDVGEILNPVGHEGQLRGGFVFGLGGALTEELYVSGGRVVTADFRGYKIPARTDVPPLRIELLAGGRGPGAYAAKAVGELVNTLVAPAIANAVEDAVGARITSLPITPDKIWAAMSAADTRSGALPTDEE